MRVEIIGKNLEVTEAIRSRIIARFEKLQKWQITLINPHVTISEEPNRQYKVEACVGIPGADLVASSEQEDMYAAINEAGQKLEKQINKKAHKPAARRASHSDIEIEAAEDNRSNEAEPI